MASRWPASPLWFCWKKVVEQRMLKFSIYLIECLGFYSICLNWRNGKSGLMSLVFWLHFDDFGIANEFVNSLVSVNDCVERDITLIWDIQESCFDSKEREQLARLAKENMSTISIHDLTKNTMQLLQLCSRSVELLIQVDLHAFTKNQFHFMCAEVNYWINILKIGSVLVWYIEIYFRKTNMLCCKKIFVAHFLTKEEKLKNFIFAAGKLKMVLKNQDFWWCIKIALLIWYLNASAN